MIEDDVAAPTLGESELAELAEFGDEREVAAGDVLFRAGDAAYDFIVVLDGAVEIVRDDTDQDRGPIRKIAESGWVAMNTMTHIVPKRVG